MGSSPYRRLPRRTAVLAVSLLAAFLAAAPLSAQPFTVGYYDMSLGAGNTNQAPAITSAGQTAVRLTDLTAGDLAGIDILLVQNPSNSTYGSEFLSRLTQVHNAVAGGMILVLHDRYVTAAETVLPGFNAAAPPDELVRSFSNDIQILDAATKVTNGAGGVLTATSLDGGNFSSQGYGAASLLPAGARAILSRTAASEVVLFSYPHGDGAVIYSTIPLDLFLSGQGAAGPRSNFTGIYAPNVVDYAAQLALAIPNLSLTLDDGMDEAVPGEAVTYLVTVANNGPGDAPMARVEMTPAAALTGVAWTCTASGTGSCAASGTGAIDDVASLSSGDSLVYRVTGTVLPSATGTLTSTAVVTNLEATEPELTDNSDADADALTPVADLVLAKTGPVRVERGGTAVYELVVTNLGPSDAAGVVLSDPTPQGLTFTSADAPCAGGFPCDLGTLAAGASRTIQATYDVSSLYFSGEAIVNRAAVTSSAAEDDPASNTSTTTTPVGENASANLGVTVTAPASGAAGSTITYRARVTNAGPHDARGVTLAVTGPPGTALVAATAPCGDLTFPCDLGTLRVGESAVVEVSYGIPAARTGSLPFTASAASSTADPATGNNSASASPVPQVGADTYDLILTKNGPAGATPGGTVTYSLTVVNLGPADAPSTLLSDPDPAGLTFVSATEPCAAGFPCALGTLESGTGITVEATWQIAADYLTNDLGDDPVVNTASVSASVTASLAEGFPGDETDSAVTGLAGEAIDLSLVKSGPASVEAGNPITYTLTVTNGGPGTAPGVVLEEDPPSGITLASITPPCAGGFPCALGDLAPGETAVVGVTFDIDPDHTFPDPLVNTASVSAAGGVDADAGDDSSEVSTDVTATADLSITKDDGLTETAAGLTVTYTVRVENLGPGDVAGATVSDDLTSAQIASAAWTCAAETGASCTASGSGDIADTVDLPAGTAVVYTAEVTLAGDASGQLVNTASVAAPAGVTDPVAENDSATDTDTIVAAADLVVTKDGPAQAVPGTNLVYTITVENTGGGTADDTLLTDPTPAGLTLVSVTAPCAGGFPCDLGDLGPDDEVTLTVTYSVPSSYAGPEPIVNTATASTPRPVVNSEDDSATESTPVVRTANLAAAKGNGTDVLVPGETVTYTLTASNPAGPSDALGARVVDALGGGSAALLEPAWTCAAAGGAACPGASGSGLPDVLVDLPVGGSVSFTLTARVDPKARTAVINTWTVFPPAGVDDPNFNEGNPAAQPGNNVASDTDGLQPRADLSVTKVRDRAEVVPGEPVSYTLRVSNAGPSAVTGARLTDMPPPALLSPTWTCAVDEAAAPGCTAAGATCSGSGAGGAATGSGSGPIDLALDLPPGCSAVYELSAAVADGVTGDLTNTATVAVPPAPAPPLSAVIDPVPGNNTASDTAPLLRKADVSVIHRGPGVVFPGSSLVYVVTVANAGPSSAAVSLTAPPPAGLSGPPAVEAPCAGGFPCALLLAPGDAQTFTVTYDLPAGYDGPDPVVGYVAAASDARDTDPSNNLSTSATAVARPRMADLAVVKTSPVVAAPGSPLTYRLAVTNHGPDDAPVVVLDETFPAGLTFVSATAPCGEGFACALGTVNAGETVEVDVTFLIPADYAGDSLIVNQGSVSSAAADPVPGNNSDDALTTLDANPVDLVVDLRAPTRTDPGEALPYRLTVTNRGPAAATNVTLAAPTPPGLTFVSASAPCAEGFPCFLDQLASGATVELEVVYQVPAPAPATSPAAMPEAPEEAGTPGDLTPRYGGPPVVTFTASVDGNELDAFPANDSATRKTGVGAEAADLSITKRGPGTAVAGTPAVYDLIVLNRGPGPAVGALLTDPAPTGTAWSSGTEPCDAAGPCAVGSGPGNALAAGSAVAVQAAFLLNSNLTSGAVITNQAQVTSGSRETAAGDETASAATTVVRNADLQVTMDGPEEPPAPGTEVVYTVRLTNLGPSDVTGAGLTTTLDGKLTGLAWSCTPSAGATCAPKAAGTGNVAVTVSLPAGKWLEYEVEATIPSSATGSLTSSAAVTSPLNTPDPTADNNSAGHTVDLQPVADLGITKTDGSTTAVPGEEVTYTLTVTNAGPSDVAGAVVEDSFPAVLTENTWTCVASAGSSCTASGSGDLLDTVNLRAGGTLVYTTTGTAAPDAEGVLTNTATVTAPEAAPDPDEANDTATDTSNLVPAADLGVSLGDGVTSVSAGTATTYTLTVTNAGPSDADGARVTTVLTAAATSVAWTCAGTGGGTCAASGTGVLNQLVDLPAGASVVFQLEVNTAAGATGQLIHTARVAAPASVGDPNAANNEAVDTDALVVEADLTVALGVAPVPAVPGEAVTYTLTAGNLGPSNATVARLTDDLPASLTGITWTCSGAGGGSCPAAGSGDLNFDVTLPVGATVTVEITASLAPDARGLLPNTASITPGGGAVDPETGNNTATLATATAPRAELSVVLEDLSGEVIEGGEALYRVTAGNAGPSTSLVAAATLELPAGLAFASVTPIAGLAAGDCAEAAGVVTCDIAPLTPGAEAVFEVRATAEEAGSAVVTAEVNGAEPDTHAADDTAEVTTDILTSLLFQDGFESGDTSAWSLVQE